MKTDHADLLNTLHYMSTNPGYALRRQVLRDAEALIYAQEQEINRLKALVGSEPTKET